MPDSGVSAAQIESLLEALFPICRSITGDGVRQTLHRLAQEIPLTVHEIPSGKKVFDWTVPDEWNIRDAWLKDSGGRKIADFRACNVSVVSYSEPVEGRFTLAELREHLHSLHDMPDAIPYRTTYYRRNWGFCLPHRVLEKLDPEGEYEAKIDSSFKPQGSLTLADSVHRGESSQEILLSTYCCHPSLANDNLSGLITASLLFQYIRTRKTRFTYRLVIAPETIGVIAYLFENEANLNNLLGGAVITTTGGPGPLGLKPSFHGNHLVDRAARMALDAGGLKWTEYPFVPDGSDERQYASPGFRIPTISITKDKYYEYPQYHTSLDDLTLVTPTQLKTTLETYVRWFHVLEDNRTYVRPEPHCEFQLGPRGLYPQTGGAYRPSGDKTDEVTPKDVEAFSWLMFGCDGHTSLLDLAERSRMPWESLVRAARILRQKGLIREQSEPELRL